MKAVYISLIALIGAISGIAMAVVTKNSEALATSILAFVTCFLPAIQLILPWFTQWLTGKGLDGAQISFLWSRPDGTWERLEAYVAAEELALHTYPVPPQEIPDYMPEG